MLIAATNFNVHWTLFSLIKILSIVEFVLQRNLVFQIYDFKRNLYESTITNPPSTVSSNKYDSKTLIEMSD